MNLGRYEIVRELGKGAMGVVYLAKDPLIGRMVALKTLRTSLLDDDGEGEEFRARFLREAQTAGILNHPAIVMIHDVGEDKTTGISFIAMEYVEGKNLKQLVQEGIEFPPDRVADIVAQVAEGLDYAHAKAIVHRDVKPANIILTEDGKAKITDFGIAKIQSSNLTSTGQFLGTPNYMSPEQVSGGIIDHRSDLFSLGVVLYEMLTKKKPFAGENLTQISYKIVHEAFVRPRDVRSNIPPGFDGIFDRALSKDPSRRYQRGKEFAEELRRIFPATRMTTFADVGSGAVPAMPPPSVAATRPVATTVPTQVPAPPRSTPAAAPTTPAPPPPPAPVPPRPAPRPAPLPPAAAPVADTIFAKDERPERPVRETAAEPAAAPRPTAKQILFAEIYDRWFWVGTGIAVIVLLSVVVPLAVRAFGQRGTPVDHTWVEKTAQKKKLVEEIESALASGKLDVADAKLREFLIHTPDSARGLELRQELERAREKAGAAQRTRAEVERLLAAGKILLDEGTYDESARAFRDALVLDPANATAKEFLAQAEQALAAKGGPGAAQGGETITARAPAQLLFRSAAIGKGFLLVYFGQTQVYRATLDFSKKTGFLSSEETGGEIRKTLEVPAGEQQVRVQFSDPDRKLEAVQTIRGNFPVAKTGKPKTIQIDLDASGKRLTVRVL